MIIGKPVFCVSMSCPIVVCHPLAHQCRIKRKSDMYTYRGLIVQKLLEYQAFKSYYMNDAPKDEVPVNELIERIPPEIVLELYVFCFSCVNTS